MLADFDCYISCGHLFLGVESLGLGHCNIIGRFAASPAWLVSSLVMVSLEFYRNPSETGYD
jgi:hypothetical protein